MRAALLLLVVLGARGAAADVEPGERLPSTFAPSGYRLRLSVEDRLVGAVEIAGALASPTRVVWLDFAGTVTRATAQRGAEIVPLRVEVHGARIALFAEALLAAGPWSLAVEFTSKIDQQGVIELPRDGEPREVIREEMAAARGTAVGAFRQVVDGAAYTFTQSEPMDARKIFPCIDEPDRKVPWQLTLDIDDTLLAASNAPLVKETPLGHGRKRVEFAATRPLPSYLVAFAVGPFDAIDAGTTAHGVPVRILETHGHAAPWAAATAVTLLAQIETWTQIPYGYDKLDLVAVPRTGAHWAAMENPGLVTFADWVIRGDGSREAKKTWVSIASHEFAHQWFGDLVTMAWWNDIWLNESFAVWLAREMTEAFDPAMADPPGQAYFDLVDTARPAPGGTNYEDYFIGGRGARAIASMAELLGAKAFRVAIHDYLADHAHGNATTADLARALASVYGAPLEPALLDLLDSSVIPHVAVRATCASIELTVRGIATRPTPVCVSYEAAGKRAHACRLVATTAEIPIAACPRWIVPNADDAMRYTTQRTHDELLAAARGWPLLTTPERAAVLAEVGPDLELAFALREAPDARVWATETIAKAAALAPDPVKLAAWLGKTYVARARQLHLDPRTREDEAVIAAASLVRDPALEREAIAAAAKLHDIRTAVLGAVVRLALRADPALLPAVIGELDRAFFERRRALLHALPAELLARDPASLPTLTAGDRLVMLADTCDPARRKEAQAVASALSDGVVPVLRAFNACLDTRERDIELWRRQLR